MSAKCLFLAFYECKHNAYYFSHGGDQHLDFTKAVQAAMDAKGMSKADVARATGRTYQYISDLMKGERRWHEKIINEVCNALGIQVSFQMSESKGEEQHHVNSN